MEGKGVEEQRPELTNAPSSIGAQIYDENGNVLTNQGGDRAFVYDDENRLIQYFRFNLAGSSSNLLTRFVYDGIERLRERIEAHWEDISPAPPNGPETSILPANWVSDSETHYVYDGWRVIQERDSNNVQTVSYTRGTDLSGSLEGAGGIGGLLARSQFGSGSWTNHDFYFADANGNITALVNTSQSLSASYRYDPFGNTISQSGIMANANVYRFSSKEVGTNTGMYYYGYRFYDPSLQRWITRDPIEEQGGLNLYTCVYNSLVNAVDLFGLQVNVNLFPSNQAINTYANSVPASSNTFTVGGHGSPNAVFDANGHPLTPQQLARQITNNPNYRPGEPVRLLSCNTGVGGTNSFAQLLANQLHTTVAAPNNFVWYYPNGNTVVAPAISNVLVNGPSLGNRGQFNVFTNR